MYNASDYLLKATQWMTNDIINNTNNKEVNNYYSGSSNNYAQDVKSFLKSQGY